MTDEELLDKFTENPELALELVYKKFGKQVYTTIFNIVRDTQEAEEITQDVFVKIFKSIDSFNRDSKLSTWVYRIAVNKSLDALRKRNIKKNIRRITRFFSADEQDLTFDKQQDPSTKLENKELNIRLFEAIEKLPESQKTAYLFVKVQNMSYQEAADIMDKSLSSLESLLVRANKSLRIHLATYFDENYK